MIKNARANNEIRTRLDDDFLAHHVFYSGFRQTFRWWAASDRPALNQFIADLNEVMRLLVYGMEPAEELPPPRVRNIPRLQIPKQLRKRQADA